MVFTGEWNQTSEQLCLHEETLFLQSVPLLLPLFFFFFSQALMQGRACVADLLQRSCPHCIGLCCGRHRILSAIFLSFAARASAVWGSHGDFNVPPSALAEPTWNYGIFYSHNSQVCPMPTMLVWVWNIACIKLLRICCVPVVFQGATSASCEQSSFTCLVFVCGLPFDLKTLLSPLKRE